MIWMRRLQSLGGCVPNAALVSLPQFTNLLRRTWFVLPSLDFALALRRLVRAACQAIENGNKSRLVVEVGTAICT